jgi:hypothetical protein
VFLAESASISGASYHSRRTKALRRIGSEIVGGIA